MRLPRGTRRYWVQVLDRRRRVASISLVDRNDSRARLTYGCVTGWHLILEVNLPRCISFASEPLSHHEAVDYLHASIP